MREIADLRAGAVDDRLVGADQRVELRLQRLDLGGQLAFEAARRPGADGSQAALDLAQRQQAEAHLEQRHRDEAEAGQRQRHRQAVAEVRDEMVEPVLRTGDDDGIARFAGSCPSVSITSTMRSGSPFGPSELSQRAPDSSGSPTWLVGRGQRPGGERGRDELAPAVPVDSGVICQYQPECVTSNSGS